MSEASRPDLDHWRSLGAAELERQYDARGTVPDATACIRAYRDASTPMYQRLPCQRGLAYGEAVDERLDLFSVTTQPDAPLFLFIHGGYWRALAKEDSVFMAECFTRRGIALAAVDYSLAPQAPLETIVDQCRRALLWLLRQGHRRIVVGGSSAGAHLAAMLLAEDWQREAGVAAMSVPAGMLVSGLFDLRPVQRAKPNEWLKLDEQRARELSPVEHLPRPGVRLAVAVAEHDTLEFRRQSMDFERLCRSRGCSSRAFVVPARNHFDIILDWMDPQSELSRATWELF